MKVESFNSICEIKEIWVKLYQLNKQMSPFQSYEWNEELEYSYLSRKKNLRKTFKIKYYLFDNRIIAPMVFDMREKIISIMGQHECSDYLSFIFQEITLSDMEFCMNFFYENYPKYIIVFDRINENNLLFLLMEQLGYKSKKQKVCVAINIPDKYLSFYDGLTKNAKQNYRTRKNRIYKNNILLHINISTKVLNIGEAQELNEIYKERREDKIQLVGYKKQLHNVKQLIKKILNIQYYDCFTNYSVKNEVFLAEIFLNGQVAAFFEGLKYTNGNIYIVRAATKKDYYYFSPGLVLIVETIESLKGTAKCFDLTRGDEEYKTRMGGIRHYNYCYTFRKD